MSNSTIEKAHILVIEDEAEICQLLELYFTREGWKCTFASSGESGLAAAKSTKIDCLILDIMLPGIDGIEVIKKFKSFDGTSSIPVIMTSAKGEDSDVILGLELGAHDYIVKPFSPRILVARVRAALRMVRSHHEAISSGVVEHGNIRLYPDRHEVQVHGVPIDLTPTEFGILELLMRRPGIVFTRNQIIDAIHGERYAVTDRSVDVQIVALRGKLQSESSQIQTVRGLGYKLIE